jgi:uncharacterized membrane protein YqgA involved in biofilm formation
MNGAFLNALGILLGALFGLVRREPLSARTQERLRTGLGMFIIAAGGWLIWENLGAGFGAGLANLMITFLAVVLGFWLGKLLGFQKLSNRLGRRAGRYLAAAQATPPGSAGAGLFVGLVLFGAAPLGWLGAVQEGCTGWFTLLAAKALMDALAMAGFVRSFGWPVALSAFPLYGLLGLITLACQRLAVPYCAAHHLLESVNAATGLVACVVSLVIFQVRKVELANFLPALAIAPLLTWLWGRL